MTSGIKALGALLGSVLLLTGCSQLTSGTIVQKEYEPGHYYSEQRCSQVLPGKGVVTCRQTEQYAEDVWRFRLREDDREGTVDVTPEIFDSYEVGDYFKEEK